MNNIEAGGSCVTQNVQCIAEIVITIKMTGTNNNVKDDNTIKASNGSIRRIITSKHHQLNLDSVQQ